jgi:hypothetical protein
MYFPKAQCLDWGLRSEMTKNDQKKYKLSISLPGTKRTNVKIFRLCYKRREPH